VPPSDTRPACLRGKGAFVTHDAIGASRGEAEWQAAAACGLSWVALQVLWHRSPGVAPVRPELTRAPAELAAETAEARSRGLAPWWWAWPVPSRVDDFLRQAEASVAASPGSSAPAGWILNLETAEPGGRTAWADRSARAPARALVDGLRGLWGGPIYITTHGRLARRQPWEILSELDGVLPQAYDPECDNVIGPGGETFAARCAESYEEAFEGKQIALLLGANSTRPTCMARLAADAAAVTDGALGWWAWTSLRGSPARRAVVTAARLRGGAIPPPLRLGPGLVTFPSLDP
jgi:hypothetical protein